MNDELTQKLPFSLIAEQSLLGSILIDPASINEVADIINSEDFYEDAHKQIYLGIHELFLLNHDIDIVTLIDMLVTKGIYDKSGGEEYLKSICESVPTSINIKDYANIVKEKSLLRQLIGISGEIAQSAYSEQDSVANILDSAERKIFSIAEGKNNKGFKHIREVLIDVHGHLKDLQDKPDEVQGTKTGFSGVDNILAGMGNSDLILVGARPGMGKTSFVLNIGANVAAQTKKSVCIFSLEMSAEQLVSRVLSSEAMVDSMKLRTGRLENDDWDKIAAASSKLAGADIQIDDTTGLTVAAMKAKLRRVKNLGLVIIDYLQLLQGDSHNDNRVQEVSQISRSLKIMAKELNVPVICCTQLSRGPESRTDKKPMLSDLRDSGAIEQDADVVMFLYRDEYYKTDANSQEASVVEVIVQKNRHGSTGTVQMGWIGRYTKFITQADERLGEPQGY